MGKFGPSEIIIILFILGLTLLPQILYLITLQKTIKEISIENRKIEPNQVWLNIIPLFGLVWQFIVVNRIASSLNAEFKKREINILEEEPGRTLGIAYCTLFCCSIIPLLGFLAMIAGFICWIIYWIKINDYRKILVQNKNLQNF